MTICAAQLIKSQLNLIQTAMKHKNAQTNIVSMFQTILQG